MAVTVVNTKTVSDAFASDTTTASWSAATGNTLVVWTQFQDAGTPTVNDTAGNSFVLREGPYARAANSNYGSIFVASTTLGHASNVVTVTWHASTAYQEVVVWEINPDGGTAAFGDHDHGDGSGFIASTPSLTLAQASGVIVMAGLCDGFFDTPGTGYTGAALDSYFGYEYKVVTASEAPTINMISNSSYTMVSLLVDVTAGGGGGGGNNSHYRTMLGVS